MIEHCGAALVVCTTKDLMAKIARGNQERPNSPVRKVVCMELSGDDENEKEGARAEEDGDGESKAGGGDGGDGGDVKAADDDAERKGGSDDAQEKAGDDDPAQGEEETAAAAGGDKKDPRVAVLAAAAKAAEAWVPKQQGWAAFVAAGEAVPDGKVDAAAGALRPGQCAAIIYGGGTLSNPKAAMLSHDNVTWTAQALKAALDVTDADKLISFLPLSNGMVQTLDVHLPAAAGCATVFARPDALKGSLARTMKAVKPTLFFAVPRLYERIMRQMQAAEAKLGGLKKSVFGWARKKSVEYYGELQFGKGGKAPSCWGCAHSLVIKGIKEALGLDMCRMLFSSTGPLPQATVEYFGNLNMPIYDVYGQAEGTGPLLLMKPERWKVGSCGEALEGVDARTDKGTGELVYSGRNVFMGYLNVSCFSRGLREKVVVVKLLL